METAKRVLLEAVGWLLVVTGIAALVLPGPGLLMMFAGVSMLSRYYAWAQRRLEPVKLRALREAARSVETWPRIITATVLALAVLGCGALWIWSPPAPSWWPVSEAWWLLGGEAVALTQVASGLIALGMIVYSCRRFRGPCSRHRSSINEPLSGSTCKVVVCVHVADALARSRGALDPHAQRVRFLEQEDPELFEPR